MDPLKGTLSPAMKLWKSATLSQKMALGAFVAAGVVVIAIVVAVATRPSFAPLYSGLQQDDAAQIVSKLREQKVPYRVSGGGTAVEVSSDKVYEVRLQLAEAGLPRGGNVGFELFDSNRVGLTQFGERINYQRALQGELERTISEIDSVESARVHLVLPEEKLYTDEAAKPSASVVLKLRGGRAIAQQQVRGIVHLVSSGVEGLSADNVEVLDTSGNLLSAGPGIAGDGLSGGIVLARLEMERQFEGEIERKVQSMLDKVSGPDKAVVRINAILDFDTRETEEAIYEPGADGKGILESQQESRETYRGKGVPPASGVPGVASNIAAKPPTPPSIGENEGYERSETTSKYQITKKIQKSTITPGQVKRLQMALFVDESVESDQLKAMEKAASAAAGIDAQRGDQVVVESVPFAKPEAKKENEPGASRAKEFYFSIGKDVAAALVLMIFLFFVRSMFKTKGAAAGAAAPAQASSSRIASAQAAIAQHGAAPEVKRAPDNGEVVLAGVESEKMAQAIRGLLGDLEEG